MKEISSPTMLHSRLALHHLNNVRKFLQEIMEHGKGVPNAGKSSVENSISMGSCTGNVTLKGKNPSAPARGPPC